MSNSYFYQVEAIEILVVKKFDFFRSSDTEGISGDLRFYIKKCVKTQSFFF